MKLFDTVCASLPSRVKHFLFFLFLFLLSLITVPPQWGSADSKIGDLSSSSKDSEVLSFKVWSSLVYAFTCFTYCQHLLPF